MSFFELNRKYVSSSRSEGFIPKMSTTLFLNACTRSAREKAAHQEKIDRNYGESAYFK